MIDENPMALSDQNPSKGTKLLVFDKAKKIKYFGKCKISFTPADKCITFKLDDEASTEITFTFNRRFFVVENFLCVSDVLTKKDFIIIFSQKTTCDRVFTEINKVKSLTLQSTNVAYEEDLFKIDFFIPIVKEIHRNVAGYILLKEIILELINTFDANKKSLFFSLMVETLLSSASGKEACKVEPLGNSNGERERSNMSMDTNDDVKIKGEVTESKRPSIDLPTVDKLVCDETMIESEPEPSIQTPSRNNTARKKSLNINSELNSVNNKSDDEDSEVERETRRKSLRKRSMNISYKENFDDDDEASSDYTEDEIPPTKKRRSIVKAKNTCVLNKEKFSTSSSFLDPSNFELVEYMESGKIRKRLLVFTSQDRRKCFQYGYDSGHNHYQCRKCDPKEHFVYASVAVDDTGSRELIFGKKEHRCEPVDYVPENYTSTKIIKLPDYQCLQSSTFFWNAFRSVPPLGFTRSVRSVPIFGWTRSRPFRSFSQERIYVPVPFPFQTKFPKHQKNSLLQAFLPRF